VLLKMEGIIIRSMDYGESHKIISVYTRHHGKIGIMVHGAKKLSNRFASVSLLFTYGQFVIYKANSMGTLKQGELLQSNHQLREDLHYAAYAAYISELIDRLMPENESNEEMFEQLMASFEALQSGKDAETIMHIMEMKMLELTGYMPQLDACASCGAKLDQGIETSDRIRLSIAQGGVLCTLCAAKDAQSIHLSGAAWRVLKLFQQIDLRKLGAIGLKSATKQELKQVMRSFMDTYVDVKLKSRGFLDQMEKYKI